MPKGFNILSLHPVSSTPSSPSLLVLSSSSLSSSTLPAAGKETVFQGRGESVYSPPPSSTSSPTELENHLQAVFISCDPCMSGLVPAGKLVEYLSSLVDLQDIERWKVEELSKMLDPTGDNRCVNQQVFIRTGRDWVERAVAKEANTLEVQMGEEKEKRSEERDLSYQLDRLRVEHSDLVRTLAVTEELLASLDLELEVSRKKEASLASELKITAAVFHEMEELKLVIRGLEEQKDSLILKQELLILKNDSLNEQVEDEREQLMSIKKVLLEMSAREIIGQSDLTEKDSRIHEMSQKVEKTKLQLETEMLRNEKMESDLELCRQQLQMALSTQAVVGDSQSSCQLLDTSVDDTLAEVTVQELQSSVTPTMYSPATVSVNQGGLGSIKEEIEEVVVMDSLPYSICKKETRLTEVEAERMKNRVVEIASVLEADQESLEEERTDVEVDSVLEPAAVIVMRKLCWSSFLLALLLLSFTFLGGLEIDYQMYYPITWHMLRSVIDDCLPAPAVMVKYSTWPVVTVW